MRRVLFPKMDAAAASMWPLLLSSGKSVMRTLEESGRVASMWPLLLSSGKAREFNKRHLGGLRFNVAAAA